MSSAAAILGLVASLCFVLTVAYLRRLKARNLRHVQTEQDTPERAVATVSPRVANIQAMLAPMRDPDVMELVSSFGVVLHRAMQQPRKHRPRNIKALIRQAEAATKAYTSLPPSPSARADYMTRMCDLAERLVPQKNVTG